MRRKVRRSGGERIMQQDNDFEPDGFDVHTSVDGKHVRLKFVKDDGRCQSIVLARENLTPLVNDLQSRIDVGSVRPINAGELTIGTVFSLASTSIRAMKNGTVQLTLYVLMEDGGRTIPISIPRHQLPSLISDLQNI